MTVLGCPSWDPSEIKSPQLARASQESPGMSLMESAGHQVTLACRDVPGYSWTSLLVSSRDQVTTTCKHVPGQSLDVPHGILQRSSHPSLQACPRTVLGCPSWDPPDIKSPQLGRMSQDSLRYPSYNPPDIRSPPFARMSQDSPGMSGI